MQKSLLICVPQLISWLEAVTFSNLTVINGSIYFSLSQLFQQYIQCTHCEGRDLVRCFIIRSNREWVFLQKSESDRPAGMYCVTLIICAE